MKKITKLLFHVTLLGGIGTGYYLYKNGKTKEIKLINIKDKNIY